MVISSIAMIVASLTCTYEYTYTDNSTSGGTLQRSDFIDDVISADGNDTYNINDEVAFQFSTDNGIDFNEGVSKLRINVNYTYDINGGTSTIPLFWFEYQCLDYNTFEVETYFESRLGQSNVYFLNSDLIYRDSSAGANSQIYHGGSFDLLMYDDIDIPMSHQSTTSGEGVYELYTVLKLVDPTIFNQIYENNGTSYTDGYNDGRSVGFDEGFEEGKNIGYQNGFDVAKDLYEDADSTINSIFDGILSVGLIPLEFFMSIFNFEILGINVTSIIGAILSIMVIVILLRILLGSKAGGK